MKNTFYAILLAAGFSSRFGNRNKLLEPFRGKPLARHTLDLVCDMNQCGAGCFEKIFLVYADDDVAALAKGLPVSLIRNNSPEKGQAESVRLGVEAAEKLDCAYYIFFPCDQPLLDAGTVGLLLNAAKPGRIVEPVGDINRADSRGNPCVFSAVFRDELLALKPGEHPRLLKSRHLEAVIKVQVNNPVVLADIDTREDAELLNFTGSDLL